ncbi:sigma-54 dependent transcriptional regulator [Halodesulfovibrio sp.]|uniref:sigma-54 interaction domain-containing protein n=1 Tax=Halodesulfovibrio sp. TaxID=1912772 RepID=UPI0025C2CDA0|nr:sigma-54 dependent transcriptional regulator [Halodesulfovibrio sp.]
MISQDAIYHRLATVSDSIAMGEYDKARDLFDMTRAGELPPTVSELAEAFGMMLVKIEAREFRMEQMIDELQEAKEKLEQARQLLAQENMRLKHDLEGKFATVNIVGQNRRVKELLQQVERIADAPVTVLIAGETGTGKDLIAKTLHYQSARASAPFVALNCSGIPEPLLESELFGIEKGVASGVDARMGRFEQADGGTLFLDEIGDMPLESQAKILRVLESGEVERVGGRKTVHVDVRVVAATHKNLRQMVDEGTFREDLFYRLNVVSLEIPPLRERCDDIELLANHFLDVAVKKMRLGMKSFDASAIRALITFNWPGNVRQLENEIERAVVLSLGETITGDDLSIELRANREECDDSPLLSMRTMTLDEGERLLISRALTEADGNKSEAARLLGISREGLRKKLKRFEM